MNNNDRSAPVAPTSMPIQRYSLDGTGFLTESRAGRWVSHNDHLAAIAEARADLALLKAGPQAPAEWHKFVRDCADTHGVMVNGNRLSMLANRLLASPLPAVAPTPGNASDAPFAYITKDRKHIVFADKVTLPTDMDALVLAAPVAPDLAGERLNIDSLQRWDADYGASDCTMLQDNDGEYVRLSDVISLFACRPQAPAQVDLAGERQAFEDFMRVQWESTTDDLKRVFDDRYFWGGTSDMWTAWQAALASRPQVSAPGEKA